MLLILSDSADSKHAECISDQLKKFSRQYINTVFVFRYMMLWTKIVKITTPTLQQCGLQLRYTTLKQNNCSATFR